MAAIFKNNPDNKVGARVKWPILKHPELPIKDLRNSVLSWMEGTLIEPMEYQVINTVEHGLIILSACAAQEVELLPPKNTDGKDFPTSDEEITQVLESHQNSSVPDKYKTPDWLFKEEPVCEELGNETIRIEFKKIEHKCFDEGIVGWQKKKLIANHFYKLGLNARREEIK